LLQRIGIGIATAILGWTFASAGYVANVQQSADMLATMRNTVAFVPMLFLALSGVAMLFSPFRRGTHNQIVRELAGEAA
jgi:GPH family glycoside/pentoside/hexuronide:cation symporter